MTRQRQHISLVGAQPAASDLGTISKTGAFLALGVFLFACALVAPSLLGDCRCHRPEKDDKTRGGANEFVLDVPKETYRTLEGIVVGPADGRSIENALVEVFDHPEYLLSEDPFGEHPEQKRVAACRTGADGKFCIRGLPPGKYELRSSIESGWNITHIYVVVDKKGQSKKIQVWMKLGT